ncbi:MAG: TolC family protein, partial [Gemmatimonadales bacterium]
VNPAIRAAQQRVNAARARIGPAGLRPDPVLMLGVRDFPVAKPGFSDNFTMKMIGIGQTFRYPGKLRLGRLAAVHELAATEASLAAEIRRIRQEVQAAYYDLVFLERALEIVEQNRSVLVSFIRITEARYGVGDAGQQDVLKARVETARLGESAAELKERRPAALARLNALLDRPTSTPVGELAVPARIARAAVADSASQIRFVSFALGSRAADSPLPPLAELQETAVAENPVLREHRARIAAQAARVDLSRKAYLPDFDVSLQYGQRDGFTDMVTAMVAIPLPLQKGRKQDLLVADAQAELAALEAAHHAEQNAVRAEVARLYAELERDRAQLALYVKAILPQGRAALASAAASYQVGRVEFLTLLDNQATLFNYETQYFQVLTEFAKTLAELERTVGKEILR